MSEKAPAFQFYPGDWRRDIALQSCSLAARGLWHECLCLMHDGDPYGHLAVNGNALTVAQIARMVGEKEDIVVELLSELEAAGVFSRTDDGTIFSRRMVRDGNLREVRREAGKRGGNPILVNQNSSKTEAKAQPKSEQTGKQNPTPASASATASAEENTPPCSPPSRRPKAERASRMPEGFRPNEKHVQMATEMGVSLQGEFAKFVDHHRAKGSVFVDWDAALRTWLRRAGEMAVPRQARLPSIVTEGAHDEPPREITAEESAQAQALIAARERTGRLKEWARAGPEQRRRILNSIPLPERSQFVAEAEAVRP